MTAKLIKPEKTLLDFYKHCPNCRTKFETGSGYKDCPNCSFTYYFNPAPCVTVLIEHPKEDKILLARRAVAPAKGEWDMLGGFIEPEETAEEAAVREVKEESGLDIKIVKYLGSQPDWYGPVSTLCFLYWAKVSDNIDIMKAEDDVESLNWFPLEEIPTKLAFINVKVLIERYLKAKNE